MGNFLSIHSGDISEKIPLSWFSCRGSSNLMIAFYKAARRVGAVPVSSEQQVPFGEVVAMLSYGGKDDSFPPVNVACQCAYL